MKIVKTTLLTLSLVSVGTATPGFIGIADKVATIGIVAGPFMDYLESSRGKKTNIGWSLSYCSTAVKAAIFYCKHLETQNKILEALEATLSTNQKILEKLEKKETE